MRPPDDAAGAGPAGAEGRAPSGRLRRELGLLDAVGVGLGAIIGAGIFVVTGVAAGLAGPAFLVGLVLAGFAATCNALSSAQLAATYPHSGGSYEYGYRVLSPTAGFAAGWMFLVSKIAAAGTVALGLSGYLHTLAPGVHPRVIAVAAIGAFTVLNYLGIRRSSRANLVIVAISVSTLLLFVGAGATVFRLENLRPFAPHGWRPVMEAAAILFFAYTGYARIATLGEEVRDPERTIPRAIGITIGGALFLYFAVAVVAVGAVGAGVLSETAAPLQAAALATPLPWFALVLSIGGAFAMLGVILSQLLGLSRMGFAMARRGDLPAVLGRVHPRYEVPGNAVLVAGAVAAIVAATGSLRGVASSASFAILIYYWIANLAALRMPRSSKLFPDAVPISGMIACSVLAVSLSPPVIVTGVGVLAAGLCARWGLRRSQGRASTR